jgi:selenocysteine-specific elongation factor
MEKIVVKNIIVGIAGHVGHGKTTLAEMLTGIKKQPESQEKNRQRTAEPVILPLGLNENFSVTLMDVPGHGRYLKNTIRGLSGVDMAILVVAADDGVMPRTLDHLQVLEFLGVSYGFVVLSKCDLVNDETISLAKIEILETVQNTFLEKSPIIPYSAGNMRQVNYIIKQLEKEAGKIAGKNRDGPFRLWVDRICSFTGHGTVVCGTVQTGQVHEGDALELFPGGIQSRARTLEVHRQKVSIAVAGQQVGINLPKIAIKSVIRGMMLSSPGSIIPSRFLNVRFQLSKTTKKPLVNHQKVLVCLGTWIAPAQPVIMDMDRIEPGDSALVQFRLKVPLPSLAGDHVVISSYYEKMVLGGGELLEASQFKFRQSRAKITIGYLNALMKGDLPVLVHNYMMFFPQRPVTVDEMAKYTGIKFSAIYETVQKEVSSGEILSFEEKRFYLTKQFEVLKANLLKSVIELMENDLLKESVNIEELRNRFGKNFDKLIFNKALEDLCLKNKLYREAGGIRPPNRKVKLNPTQDHLIHQVFHCAKTLGIVPFSIGQLFQLSKMKHPKREIQKVVTFLINQGNLVQLDDGRYLTVDALEEVKQRIQKIISEKTSFTLSDCSEIVGFGRTKGAPIFDYLDSIGFTKREGNIRTLK